MNTMQPIRAAPSVWLPTTSLLVAAGVSAGALLAAGADGAAQRLAIVPFGWQRLVVVHVLCTLPLSLACARLLADALDLHERWTAPLWAGLGLLVAWLTVYAGSAAASMAGTDAEYVSRLIWRIAWCLLLQTPWFLAAQALRWRSKQPAGRISPLHHLLLGGLTAIAVPLSFLAAFLAQQTRAANALWQQSRWDEALRIVQRLGDVGSSLPLIGSAVDGQADGRALVTTTGALAMLRAQIQFARQQIDEIGGGQLSPADDLRLGRLLAGVGDVGAAKEALSRAAQVLPEAALVLAQLYYAERNFDDSRSWAERSRHLAQEAVARESDSVQAEEHLLRAYMQLALLAGELGDLARAEQQLSEALERLPRQQAAIHEQLARHYEFVGDIFQAREHRRRAAVEDPNRFAPPENLVYQVLSSGAPIGLARPGASRYR